MRAFTQAHPPSSPTSQRSNVRITSSSRERLNVGRARARGALVHNVGACGDSLRHLATTADGYTLDNPYGHVALWTDVDGWRALCRSLMQRAREHYDRLGEIEKARGAVYTQWNANNDAFNAIVEKVNQLDDVGGKWTGSDVSEAIAFCTALASEQICFLETVDAAIAGYGETPPSFPGTVKPAPPPSSVQDLASTVLKVGAVAIGAYVLVNLLKG